ncbi:MAG: 3-deoxy-manno-octulosonate cytidylyltransferase [Pantoea sp. Brub]|nr:3-deoxy-manno-octulosonate cytidylyltransferase [Pantoea sp. Brub]
MKFTVIIPARYASTRFPGKPLYHIHGKPMITHVMKNAYQSGANRVIVATDHVDIANIVKNNGGEVCLTKSEHKSGTERLYEAIEILNLPNDEIIVNLQGDEPMILPIMINRIVEEFIETSSKNKASVSTLSVPVINLKDIFNKNVVKVIVNVLGNAIYFSRAPIPWSSNNYADILVNNKIDNHLILRHVGIYVYYANFIRRYIKWSPCVLEQVELLEQLRILWYGEKIHVTITEHISHFGIDTIEDLVKINQLSLIA